MLVYNIHTKFKIAHMVQANFSFIQEIKTYKYTKQYVVLVHFSVKYIKKIFVFLERVIFIL